MMRPTNRCFIMLILVSKSFPSKERKFTSWIWFICKFNAIDRVRFLFIFCCVLIDLFSKVQNQHSFDTSTKSNCTSNPIKNGVIWFRWCIHSSYSVALKRVFHSTASGKKCTSILLSFYSAFEKATLNAKRKIHNEYKESLLIAEWKYYNLNVDSSFTCIINRCFTYEDYFQWIETSVFSSARTTIAQWKFQSSSPNGLAFAATALRFFFVFIFTFFLKSLQVQTITNPHWFHRQTRRRSKKNWIIMLMTWQNKWDAICKVTAKRVSVHFVLACARICGECYVNHCHYYIMSKLYVISALLWNISETTDLVSSIECSANRNTRACLLALLTCWWCLCTCIMRMWLKIQQCIYILYLKWLP